MSRKPQPAVLVPLEDGPSWLAALRIERESSGDISFVATDRKGHDKYEWRLPAEYRSMMQKITAVE